MPLTKKEQKTFEDMFWEITDVHPDSRFMDKLADLIFDMTGNVNLRMRFYAMAQKMSRRSWFEKRSEYIRAKMQEKGKLQ